MTKQRLTIIGDGPIASERRAHNGGRKPANNGGGKGGFQGKGKPSNQAARGPKPAKGGERPRHGNRRAA
jgi:hypothetical protein